MWLSPAVFVFASFFLSSMDALAQSSAPSMSSECLVQLKAPNADFANQAGEHLKVLAHSSTNSTWFLKVSGNDCSGIRALSDVESVSRASVVIVSLKDGETLPEIEIEKLGGIVLRKFANISAASVVVPVDKVAALAGLPGIKQVRKDRGVSATQITAQ